MKYKISRYCYFFVATLLVAPAVSWSAQGSPSDKTAQMIQRMESHWQSIVRERDPVKRKALVSEHRKMMDETRVAQGANLNNSMGGHHGQGGMMGSHHQHDLQNTAEMHTMMLDMMK